MFGCNGLRQAGYGMTVRLLRRLTVLFAMIALMLTVHQARAVEHAPRIGIEVGVHALAQGQHDAQDPWHSIGCCSVTVALSAPVFVAVFYGGSRGGFDIDVGDLALYTHLRSKHFRPPRHA